MIFLVGIFSTSVAATTLPLRSDCWMASCPWCRGRGRYSAMPVRLP